MGKENGILGKIDKACEGFFVRENFGSLAFFYNRVHDVTEHSWNLTLSFYMNHELPKDFLATDTHSGNLDDVVAEGVKSCCLSIKNNDVLRLVSLDKLLCKRRCAYGH